MTGRATGGKPGADRRNCSLNISLATCRADERIETFLRPICRSLYLRQRLATWPAPLDRPVGERAVGDGDVEALPAEIDRGAVVLGIDRIPALED